MNFRVVDEHGRMLAAGRNLASSSRPNSAARHRPTSSSWPRATRGVAQALAQRRGSRGWSFGEVARDHGDQARGGQSVIGYPGAWSITARTATWTCSTTRAKRAGIIARGC